MPLRIRWRGAALVLRLEPDPEGSRPALARGAGHSLSYAGQAPAVFAASLPELARAFAAAPTDADSEDALRAAIDTVWPDAAVEPTPEPLPRWPSTLRIGMPAPGEVWPFDAESIGLELGLRRLVKREQFSALAAERDAAWLTSRGLVVTPPGPADADGRRVIFAARDRSALEEAHALETQLRRADGTSGEAGRRLGEALGYPSCCVEAYAAIEARDDRGLAEALLPPVGAAPASPLTQWLSAPLGIVSHAPCSLLCEPTRALAERLRDALDAEAPGFTTAWSQLARRVHLLSHRRALALEVDEEGVRRAIELTVPRSEALVGWTREADEWTGRSLAQSGLGPLTDPEATASATPGVLIAGELFLVADHRG